MNPNYENERKAAECLESGIAFQPWVNETVADDFDSGTSVGTDDLEAMFTQPPELKLLKDSDSDDEKRPPAAPGDSFPKPYNRKDIKLGRQKVPRKW